MIEVYTLSDETGTRYVGQSRNAKRRRNWHIGAARRNHPGHVYDWIRDLLARKMLPEVTVLEVCPAAEADSRESYWIARKREEGCALTNATVGGCGARGWRHTEDARRRIGLAHKGRQVSVETREKISRAHRGKKLTAEHKARIGRAGKGRVVSEATRQVQSLMMQGNQRAKGCRRSEETRARMRQSAQRGALNPRARVTNEQAQEIRRRYAEGERQADLARAFGVPTVCVHRIVRGKTY